MKIILSLSLFFLFVSTFFFSTARNINAQNKFDGVARNNTDYCSLATGTVLVQKKDVNNNLVQATGLSQCSGVTGVTISQGSNTTITPRTGDNYFCFSGPEENYYLTIGSNPPYKWLAENLRAREGFYDLLEFGATSDTSKNNTYPLKNAAVYIGSRPESGGSLSVPNGVFKVSGSVPPSQPNGVSDALPILVPPGLTIEGTNGKVNYASSRIQIDNAGTILKIGGCTSFVTIRNLGFVTPGDGSSHYLAGTKAIYAEGAAPYSSQHFVFTGLTIQGFEDGIQVLGIDSSKDWQFDNIRVENSAIGGCLYPIRNDTQNSTWHISNTTIDTGNNSNNSVRGVGILIERGGLFTLDNVIGGAPKINGSITNRTLRPEAFIKVTGPASLTVRGSASEETDSSIVYSFNNPYQDTERNSLILTGNAFGDPILIKESVEFISSGNLYLSNTVQVWGASQGGNSKKTRIYSYGDTFSGVTYQRQICEASVGSPMPYGIAYAIAPTSDCRRDFYIYNNPNNLELNSLAFKTSQRRSGINDSDGIDRTTVQSPLRIVDPPVWDPVQLPAMDPQTYQFSDRLKYWSYTIKRNTSDGLLEFEGNQKPPEFSGTNYTGFRFFGNVYPSADGQFQLGNSSNRWGLVRAVTITPGDLILSDKVTGQELYRINEDENFIYFSDIRTGARLMKLDRMGNLILTGRVYQLGRTPTPILRNSTSRRHRTPKRKGK